MKNYPQNVIEKPLPDPFLKNQKYTYLWINSLRRYSYDVHENWQIFKTHHPPFHLRPKFFHPHDLGRPISNKPPPFSPNDNQLIKRKRDPRMTIICYQQSNYRIIHHLQWLLLTLPQMGHWTRYLQWLIMIGIRLPSSFSSHVISSIALSKVGRTTEINWLGSLCFVKHPNPCLWCLTTLRLWWSPPHPTSKWTSYVCDS